MPATAPVSAYGSTGSRVISRPIRTAWAGSTARRSTSMPTRAQGFHRDWNTFIYNYGRREVAEISCRRARSTGCEQFHIDGLRVDAVASMLYLDYSRGEGEWIPNVFGGRENLEAIGFLRRSTSCLRRAPAARPRWRKNRPRGRWCRARSMSAGSVSASNGTWGGCTTRSHYMSRDPIHRKYHHNDLTFGLLYAFHENFILPLSHDEVVHGKRSLIGQDAGRPLAALCQPARLITPSCGPSPARSCCSWATRLPRSANGTTMSASTGELLADRFHLGVQRLVRDLNRFYRSTPALAPARLRTRWFRLDRCGERRRRAWSPICAAGAATSRSSSSSAILHRCPRGLPHRGAAAGPLPRADQHRRLGLWRQRRRQCRRGRGRTGHPTHGHAHSLRLRLPPLGDTDLHAASPRISQWLSPTRMRPGRPYPLGATWDGDGVNFALFSAHAEKVELCLFDRSGSVNRRGSRCPNTPTRSGTAICRTRGRSLALRLSCARALRPGQRASLQSQQAVDRPLRQGAARQAALVGRRIRLSRRRSARGSGASTGATMPALCPNAGSSNTAFTWGEERPAATTSWEETIILETACTRLHQAPSRRRSAVCAVPSPASPRRR